MEILPDLSICVIARQGRENITDFLRWIFEDSYVDMQVIVMVADSALAEELGREFVEALVCEEDLSLPDAVIYNRALQFATGRYLALISEAVIARPLSFERLIDFMEDNPDIGLVGPKLLLPSGEVFNSVRLFPSFVSFLFLDCLSTELPLVNRLRRRHFLTDWDRESSIEVQWLSGLFLLFRREVMEEIGTLDEAFAKKYGGLDYCWRARRAGWHNHFLHDAEVVLVDMPEQDSAMDWHLLLDGFRFFVKKWRRVWA